MAAPVLRFSFIFRFPLLNCARLWFLIEQKNIVFVFIEVSSFLHAVDFSFCFCLVRFFLQLVDYIMTSSEESHSYGIRQIPSIESSTWIALKYAFSTLFILLFSFAVPAVIVSFFFERTVAIMDGSLLVALSLQTLLFSVSVVNTLAPFVQRMFFYFLH
jgi:hypothetical protein